jgi:2-polyprenyl-3-methyl-5-hydroxy-6-metoxy-1,4-benzoquinol methylase
MLDAGNPTELSPERAMPETMAGSLMDSEHRSRYFWAAQFAQGRNVLDAGCGTGYGSEILAAAGARQVVGVDISEDAIDYARSASPAGSVAEFSLGDLHKLPFGDANFDLVVCFEAIEHVNDQRHAIGELRRILSSTGVLVISSPNRGVYPPGNPHHTHEYIPEELEKELASEFKNVELYRQSSWLTAAILDDQQSRAVGPDSALATKIIKLGSLAPGDEIFTIALASDAELPDAHPVALMSAPFEVRWWQERLETSQVEHDGLLAKIDIERQEQGRALLCAENELANAQNEIAQLHAAEADLKLWAAKQEELIRRREEVAEDFENRLRQAERTMDEITDSLSWRITSPLRAVKRLMN